jgi:hypothetical protein
VLFGFGVNTAEIKDETSITDALQPVLCAESESHSRAKQSRPSPFASLKPSPQQRVGTSIPVSRQNGLASRAGPEPSRAGPEPPRAGPEKLEGVLGRLRTEMSERFLQFQRESELRYLAWEQVSHIIILFWPGLCFLFGRGAYFLQLSVPSMKITSI